MASIRPNFQPLQKKEITHIFLGIDFGTSYTKVSYSYAPTNISYVTSLKWNNDFFIPTILYTQNERLYFDKPDGIFNEIRYFKYSIIEKQLINYSEKTNNNFEEMCCVFFLAHVIKRSLLMITENLKISDINNLSISINMGVPLENFYDDKNLQNKGIYKEILENAVVLAGGSKIKVSIPQNQVLISNLDTVYSELCIKRAKINWSVDVFPELAAEILLYHQSKIIPKGVYAVVDIGGGTVDLALFQKSKDMYENNVLNCLGQKVLPYGIEILSKYTNLESEEREFTNSFWEIFEKAKRFVGVPEYQNIEVFFLGGGCFVPDKLNWYKNALEKRNHNRIKFDYNIDDFIKDEENLVEKNQRLLISQMLAKSIQDMESVKSFPDFYLTELEERLRAPKYYSNYHEELEDILNERYPK